MFTCPHDAWSTERSDDHHNTNYFHYNPFATAKHISSIMSPPRYESATTADVARLGQPLKFEFSKQAAPNRLMKGAMAEALATWDGVNHDASGIPTKELIEVYRR